MANAFYAKGAQKILSGAVDLANDTIKVALVKNDYAQDLTTDEFYSTLSPHVLSTDQHMGNKSVGDGVFDADDVTWPSVATGSVSEGVVIYKDTGDPATSPLLIYIDQITGFPVSTNGGNIVVQWDNGPYKIVKL